MKKMKWILPGTAMVMLMAGCSKDDDPVTPVPVTAGLYVLNEGNWDGNNTTLTYYDLTTKQASTDFYQSVNGSKLGDTGNDILIYGSKLYIVMNVSSNVEVAEAATAKSISKVQMMDGSEKRSPRYATPYKNKVLITSYDGTVAVLDTASLSIDKYITVGSNPEQMAVVGDKLYVANSGGLNFVTKDSTVSVIDLTSFTETKKIVVGTSPTRLAVGDGKLFVLCAGNYVDIAPKITSVSVSSDEVTGSREFNGGALRFYNGKLFVSTGYGAASPGVTVLKTTDLSNDTEQFISDGTSVTTPYGLDIDDETGDVFVTDAKDYVSSGEVFCFDKTGKKKYSFMVTPGVSPNKVVIVKK
ncbi:MAG: hypothetical protein QM664_06725 [Flavihumibacter sp.]